MSTLTADQKEKIMADRGRSKSKSEYEFSLSDTDGEKRAVWWVHLPGMKPFTMGGSAMTRKQALETVLCIWAKVEPRGEIIVSEGSIKP